MDISKNTHIDSEVKILSGCKYILINYLRKHFRHVAIIAIRGGGAPLVLETYIFLIFIYRKIIFKELVLSFFQDQYISYIKYKFFIKLHFIT